MKIETGTPPSDGRYIIWQPIKGSTYAEPKIADRLRGNWLWCNDAPVLGWYGPLPLRTIASFGLSWDEVFSDLRKSEHGSFVADLSVRRPCMTDCNNPKCDETRCFGRQEYDL